MVRFLRKLFPKKPETSQNEAHSSQSAVGDIQRAPLDDSRGGYGENCIPDGDLPDSIPRTGQAPTAEITSSFIPQDFNSTNLTEVNYDSPSMRSAQITNGYDRDILLEGPVLTLFVKAGETRTIKGPVFQRVPNSLHPGQFEIKGWSPLTVLRDMAAERTRAIFRGMDVPPLSADEINQASVDTIMAASKFAVREV